ncbi:hypothetical protein FNH05_32255 [Amycolatopsis rhizosphaerae]|uniref:SnoaL-like domain-containing protein n=1 Tax=Amycolatopsis rhizosphaerae TaxID=2053003 RepID=A0A558ALS6_9PSEU|nr:nuclear transport factor 2 family protein [Amycolatopsis rhizosphaerae]TVT25171.1 hypothetical protein FNH05_32255 [Amycolatopsis rhizosphaerae]
MNETTAAGRNARLVRTIFAEFAAGNLAPLREALHDDFVEHSPGNPSGRDAFLRFIADSEVAKAELDLKRVVADEEHVVVHYRMTPPGQERGLAVVDIWRLADGRIAEHWDVVQPVPQAREVPNGMF